MARVPTRDRLKRLVELAAETGVSARRELTGALADLLLDWPPAYPQAMREPFEALLEKALADVEPEARALLAERFVQRPGMPLSILNALIFDGSPETSAEILARNASAADSIEATTVGADEGALLSSVRQAQLADISRALSAHLRISADVAEKIVGDASAAMLATLIKGANLSRASFSALAVLARPFADNDEHYRRLAAYDSVPEDGARALLLFWRGQTEPPEAATQAA